MPANLAPNVRALEIGKPAEPFSNPYDEFSRSQDLHHTTRHSLRPSAAICTPLVPVIS